MQGSIGLGLTSKVGLRLTKLKDLIWNNKTEGTWIVNTRKAEGHRASEDLIETFKILTARSETWGKGEKEDFFLIKKRGMMMIFAPSRPSVFTHLRTGAA